MFAFCRELFKIDYEDREEPVTFSSCHFLSHTCTFVVLAFGGFDFTTAGRGGCGLLADIYLDGTMRPPASK